MLLLICAYGNVIRLIEQDIGCHKRRIRKKSDIDIVGMLCRLILKLGHSRRFAELRVAVENPAKLAVLRHM